MKEYKRIISERLLQLKTCEGYNMTDNNSLQGDNTFSEYPKSNSNTNNTGL